MEKHIINMNAVIIVQSFDNDTPVYVFDDHDKARAYMKWSWEECYNTEIAEGSLLDESKCFCEDEYAKITWLDGSYIEFIVSYITQHDKNFDSINWRKYL